MKKTRICCLLTLNSQNRPSFEDFFGQPVALDIMKCPYCSHAETKVIDSREAPDGHVIRRRRECLECQSRFTTFETVELAIQVHKRDGRYEDFQQKKLIRGMQEACRHTTVSNDRIIELSNAITADIMRKHLQVISTTELGHIVMTALQELDPIAYIRFACVYRRFKNIDELVDAIQTIQPKDEAKDTMHTGESSWR